MGQADVNVNLWLKDTKRFADLFNAILFHGETVILPENLHPSPETTAVSLQDAQGKNVVKKLYRDIIMNWQDQAVLMLLAVESQTAIHYAAPLKVMLYDSMEYAEQVRVKWKERPPRLSSAEFLSRFQKNDKLIPVITLIFYYGTEEWDGPLELYQMFDLGTEKNHAELMKKYLPNYHINLVDVRRLKNLESFQSDLQIIFGMLQCSQDKYALRTYVASHKDYFQKLDLETYHALAAFLKTTGRTGWTLYIPMFVMLAVTFTALIQKTIALVSNIAGGQATFLVDGLQFIVAILLMVLGVLVAFSCLKKLFTAKKQEA